MHGRISEAEIIGTNLDEYQYGKCSKCNAYTTLFTFVTDYDFWDICCDMETFSIDLLSNFCHLAVMIWNLLNEITFEKYWREICNLDNLTYNF